MPHPSFQTVEDMLHELDSLASSSFDEDDEDTESSAFSSCQSMTGSESSTTSNEAEAHSNPITEVPCTAAIPSQENNSNDETVDDEEKMAATVFLMSAIRQYCCSCDLLKTVWKRACLYAQDESSSLQEPLLVSDHEETIVFDSSSNKDRASPTKPHCVSPVKRPFTAEERVLALIHQKQSSTLGQGPKPFDTLQDILLKQQQQRIITTTTASTSYSSKALPADYWVPWNTDGYSLELTQAVRKGDVHFVRSYTGNLQCSNAYGESILHVAARRGDLALLQYMHSERDISLRVCCESARNLLHDACWTSRPSFVCIEWLLEQVPELLLVQDARGRTPLEYAPADTWEKWNVFLNEHPQLVWKSVERLEELLK